MAARKPARRRAAPCLNRAKDHGWVKAEYAENMRAKRGEIVWDASKPGWGFGAPGEWVEVEELAVAA